MSPRTTFQSCGSSSIEVRREEAADARDAGVALVDRVAGPLRLGADHHRAQLQQLEVDAVLPHPGLLEEDGAAVTQLDGERGGGEHGAREREARAGSRDVEGAVHSPSRRIGWPVTSAISSK